MHINIICCSKKTYKHDTSLIASDRFETIIKLSLESKRIKYIYFFQQWINKLCVNTLIFHRFSF